MVITNHNTITKAVSSCYPSFKYTLETGYISQSFYMFQVKLSTVNYHNHAVPEGSIPVLSAYSFVINHNCGEFNNASARASARLLVPT